MKTVIVSGPLGLLALLTIEQRHKVLAYQGPEVIGPVEPAPTPTT